MATVETVTPNAALSKETTELEETAKEEVVEIPPAAEPEDQQQPEKGNVEEPVVSETKAPIAEVELGTKETEDREEKVVIPTEEKAAPEVEPESINIEETKEEHDSVESPTPEAGAPEAEVSKEEDEKEKDDGPVE